jgi:hypothetical protein
MPAPTTPQTTAPFAEVERLTLAGGAPLGRARLAAHLARFDARTRPRLRTLWAYYRNPMEDAVAIAGHGGVASRGYRLAQERGLPGRIAGHWDRRGVAARLASDDRTWSRKEVVIENDIAWRIHTMVDFMFGRPIAVQSTAADAGVRREVEAALDAVWEASGGIGLLQDMGLLGHVYGHVDLVVRVLPEPTSAGEQGGMGAGEGEAATVEGESAAERAARRVRIELVEPTAGVALLGEDGRTIDAYVIRRERETAPPTGPADPPAPALRGSLMRLWRKAVETAVQGSPADDTPIDRTLITEVFAGGRRQVFESPAGDAGAPRLVAEGPALAEARDADRPPVIHIQNISQPFDYAGLGEVEPLLAMQDELNTRLSDRASRVTLQSFKMLLAKGLDGAESMPIAPGIVWSTDNADAEIQSFGGDGASPSEDRHIDEVREAMDKASGVPPLAAGVVRAKIGNLTSENALKVTLMGLLSKTARKRVTYGRGVIEASRLALEALDRLGILRTTERDRGLRVDWPDPLPRDLKQELDAAVRKVELGVPRERVLSELGYAPVDPGVV